MLQICIMTLRGPHVAFVGLPGSSPRRPWPPSRSRRSEPRTIRRQMWRRRDACRGMAGVESWTPRVTWHPLPYPLVSTSTGTTAGHKSPTAARQTCLPRRCCRTGKRQRHRERRRSGLRVVRSARQLASLRHRGHLFATADPLHLTCGRPPRPPPPPLERRGNTGSPPSPKLISHRIHAAPAAAADTAVPVASGPAEVQNRLILSTSGGGGPTPTPRKSGGGEAGRGGYLPHRPSPLPQPQLLLLLWRNTCGGPDRTPGDAR